MDNKRNFNVGKVVYFINGMSFENDKGVRNGKEKALAYCLDNFLNPNDIQKFDSRTERDRYVYLLEQQKQGLISNLGHHYTLRILPTYENANGDIINELTYEADFIYFDNITNQRIVEDVKGSEFFINEDFITKKKVFDYLMKDKGLFIRVILYRNKEWVEYHLGETKKSSKLIKKQREQIKQLKQEKHERELADNLKARELKRLSELESMTNRTKAQEKRYQELRGKYEKASV